MLGKVSIYSSFLRGVAAGSYNMHGARADEIAHLHVDAKVGSGGKFLRRRPARDEAVEDLQR
jgi:hypothetical protein